MHVNENDKTIQVRFAWNFFFSILRTQETATKGK